MIDSVDSLHDYTLGKYGWKSFTTIAIETSSVCNRGCNFCPVGHDRKPVTRLSDGDIKNIIDQLVLLNYRDRVCLNWYNEPMADTRLSDIVRMLKCALPGVFVYFATNGDFLNLDSCTELVDAGLDQLLVSQYDGRISDAVASVQSELKWKDRVVVQVKPESILTNSRGGAVLHLIRSANWTRCIRPDLELIVASTGDVPLCCNDYFVKYSAGNIRAKSLKDLWRSKVKEDARAKLRAGDRSIDICSVCEQSDIPYGVMVSQLQRGRIPTG